MQILLALILFCGGLYIIIKGGDVLVNAALCLNKVTGINQVVIGATFVSIATTLPEVFVSVFAVAAGHQGIAVGNALGAMICNIALVMAIYLAMMFVKISRRDILGKSIFLVGMTLVVILFAANLRISGIEAAVLFTVFIIFLLMNAREARRREDKSFGTLQQCLDAGFEAEVSAVGQGAFGKGILWRRIILGFAGGQALLVVGAFLLVTHGERLAILLGASETVVGLTVIATGTSMPELITCLTSVKKKSGGLAIGNVFGANIINCTLLLGACGLVSAFKGETLPISRDLLYISLPFLLLITLITVVPMFTKQRTFKWQGYLLLLLYAAYVGYLLILQPT